MARSAKAPIMALAGGIGSLASAQPIRTTGSKLNHATTLFDYIRRAMPFDAPKSLRDDEVYALTAYVLNLNDILPADASLDRESIVGVKMSNRDGFTTRHGLMRVHGEPDTHATGCMHDCAAEVDIASRIPDHAQGTHGDLALQMRHWSGAEAPSAAAAPGAVPGEIASRSGCMACHGIAKGIVGPAFADVAQRYHGDGTAEVRLVRKVEEGGAGVWGSAPMPSQRHVPPGDVLAIVRWILAGARQ